MEHQAFLGAIFTGKLLPQAAQQISLFEFIVCWIPICFKTKLCLRVVLVFARWQGPSLIWHLFALQERKRTAQLLSQLPADIDIAMLLQSESATVAASVKKGKKGIAPAGSSANAFKSVRVD